MALQLIKPATIDQLAAVLRPVEVGISLIEVRFQDHLIRTDAIAPAANEWQQFRWQQKDNVWQRGTETQRLQWQWLPQGNPIPRAGFTTAHGADPILQLDTAAGTHIFANVPLARLYQDEEVPYCAFKLGNGASGRNRWFGRSENDARPVAVTEQLGADVRAALQTAFPGPLLYPDGASATPWLILARIPLAELAAPPDAVALKTRLFASLLQSVVIGEKLRELSFSANPPPPSTPMKHSLNQILFGPPGTGKTYQSIAYAVAIIEDKDPAAVMAEAGTKAGRAALQARFTALREAGQIGFVTFHQSFSYEDFVEGIKPDMEQEGEEQMRYKIEAGIFRRMSARAVEALARQHQRTEPIHTKPDFDTLYSLFAAHLDQQLQTAPHVIMPSKAGGRIALTHVNEAKASLKMTFLDGNPSYFYPVTKVRFRKLYELYNSTDDIKAVTDIRDAVGGSGSTLYWSAFKALKDFEKTLPATVPANRPDVRPTDESALALATDFDFAKLTLTDYTTAPRFVLLIDEINRGNVAGIFGELITLLEDDKRAGAANEISVTLPYSKATFTVPPNLYLLGTMNTADRSVEALDTALRRRFSFVEMAPLPSELSENVAGVDLRKLLTVINQRLESLLDRDHQLGHAWLMGLDNLDALRDAFARKIIPQLQEYFFGNWARIGLVLGKRFVTEDGAPVTLAPGFALEDGDELKRRYRITDHKGWTAADFQSIYTFTGG